MKTRTKTILIIISVILLLSIIPSVLLTLKSIPRPGDDFESSVSVVHVWRSTHNLFAVIKEAWHMTLSIYQTHQGSIAAVFIMCMSPIVFSLTVYRIVLFCYAVFFLFAAYYFLHSFLVKRLKLDKHYLLFIYSVFVFTAMYFNMDSQELLYWFNGSSYYFLTFSVYLLFTALLNELFLAGTKKSITRIVLLFLMAIFLGLNNLAMSIMCFVSLFFALCYALRNKHVVSKTVILIMSFFVVCLLINALAPGYRVRIGGLDDEMGTEKISTMDTMIQSFRLSIAELVKLYLKLSPLPVVMLLTTPLLIGALKTSGFKGYKPILVLIATTLIYISQYPPVVMVFGQKFLPRITNIRFLVAQLLFLFNYMNIMASIINSKKYASFGFNEKGKARILYGVLVLVAIANIGLIAKHEISNDLNITRMVKQWRSGEISTFIQEGEYRLAVLNDDSVKVVEFKPMTYNFTILGWDLIVADKNDIYGVQMSQFYDKDEVYAVK